MAVEVLKEFSTTDGPRVRRLLGEIGDDIEVEDQLFYRGIEVKAEERGKVDFAKSRVDICDKLILCLDSRFENLTTGDLLAGIPKLQPKNWGW